MLYLLSKSALISLPEYIYIYIYLAKCPVSSTRRRKFISNSGTAICSGANMIKIRVSW